MYEFSDQNLDPESVSPIPLYIVTKWRELIGRGILLNGFRVLLINVAIFNNSGTGIWNAHTDKEAKLFKIYY